MATFISLIKTTQRGIEEIKDGPARLEQAKQAFKAMGGELKELFLVMGHYDMVVIGEAPDDETAVKLALRYARNPCVPL